MVVNELPVLPMKFYLGMLSVISLYNMDNEKEKYFSTYLEGNVFFVNLGSLKVIERLR
jgi:hypothetical protein